MPSSNVCLHSPTRKGDSGHAWSSGPSQGRASTEVGDILTMLLVLLQHCHFFLTDVGRYVIAFSHLFRGVRVREKLLLASKLLHGAITT